MDTEIKAPAALLLTGIAIFIGYGFWAAGPAGAGVLLMLVSAQIIIGVALGIPALFVAASVGGMSFGPFNTAVLKLAAIFVFPTAISLLIPSAPLAWLASFLLYYGLLSWLFDLEGRDVIICAFIIWLIRGLAFFLGALAFASAF